LTKNLDLKALKKDSKGKILRGSKACFARKARLASLFAQE